MIRTIFISLATAGGFALCAATASSQASSPSPSVAAPAASTSKADEAKFGIYPIAYKELVIRWLETQLLDPASAQIEWEAEPTPVEIKGRDGQPFAGYVVDFKVNSRNQFGSYTGKQVRRVYIRNGEIAGGGRKPK